MSQEGGEYRKFKDEGSQIRDEVEEQKNENNQDPLNLSIYSNLNQDDRNNSLFPSRQQLPAFWKYGHKFDIFGFLPVPKTSLVSSRRSQIASCVCLFLMFAFVGYTIYDFFFNNTPRLNTYSTPINYNQEFEVQDFAFGFYEMDTSSNLIEDPTIFSYYLEQYIYSNLPGNQGHEELSKQVAFEYCTPEWAPVKIKMLCPKEQMYMQGMIGKGDYLKYPRLKILACDKKNTQGIKCDDKKAISEFPKGRLFIFMKQDEQINFATDETLAESGIFYYYFIVPQLYDRAETIIGNKVITKYPNYGSSFQEKVYNYQSVINNNLYISDVNYFFPDNDAKKDVQNKLTQNGSGSGSVKTQIINYSQFNLKDAIKSGNHSQKNFQQNSQFQGLQSNNEQVDPVNTKPYFAWWMSISPTQVNIEVNYKTSANMISLWGGLWGVLVAAFTFIYMTYNAKQFYTSHKQWDRFDNVLQVNRVSTHMDRDFVQNDNSNGPNPHNIQSLENDNQGGADGNKKISINA